MLWNTSHCVRRAGLVYSISQSTSVNSASLGFSNSCYIVRTLSLLANTCLCECACVQNRTVQNSVFPAFNGNAIGEQVFSTVNHQSQARLATVLAFMVGEKTRK